MKVSIKLSVIMLSISLLFSSIEVLAVTIHQPGYVASTFGFAARQDFDLTIGSGGEHRISNFLIWQIAYSELYVTNILWPDFKCRNLIDAIEDYQKRERRFGLISEQISEPNNNTKKSVNLTDQLA